MFNTLRKLSKISSNYIPSANEFKSLVKSLEGVRRTLELHGVSNANSIAADALGATTNTLLVTQRQMLKHQIDELNQVKKFKKVFLLKRWVSLCTGIVIGSGACMVIQNNRTAEVNQLKERLGETVEFANQQRRLVDKLESTLLDLQAKSIRK